MAVQRTFSIIKPDATARTITGKVNAKIEEAGLRIIAKKRVSLSKEQAGGFYAVHKERPFYNDLVAFMMSGPVVVQVLEGENAIATYRKVMGATNPAEADAGTIAPNLRKALTPTPFTAQTRRKQRQKRLSSSLATTKSLVK